MGLAVVDVGDGDLARPVKVKNARNAEHRIRLENQWIKIIIIEPPVEHINRLVTAGRPHGDPAIDDTYVMAFDQLGAHLVRLYRSLSAMVGGDDEVARAWLQSANQAFGGRTPLESIRSVEGLVHACDYVDAHRARV